MLMDISPATDRLGLINLSAAIEGDALRIATLGECILETMGGPDVTARQLGMIDALANTVKIMAGRIATTAAKVEVFAGTLPEEPQA